MEEDVLQALQTRAAYLPPGFDRAGRVIVVVSGDATLWQGKCVELAIGYLRRALSAALLQRGVAVIVDAQRSGVTRTQARSLGALFGEAAVTLFLVRAECFWEKHMEQCTKSQAKGEPIVLSKARLPKYFDLEQLPPELGGSLRFNYDLWLQQRKAIDEFQQAYAHVLSAMDNLHVLLLATKALRPAEADVELKKCTQLHADVQRSVEAAIEMGNRILSRLAEAYAPPPAAQQSSAPVPTPPSSSKPSLPPDLAGQRQNLELRLNDVEKRQTQIRTAWLELLQQRRELRELQTLEEGVAFVTNWILGTAEPLLLSRQQAVGCDVRACEALRLAHDALELECTSAYGHYAELLYKIDRYAGAKDSSVYADLIPQREFMQFVCRAFATRLERRRNVLITSQRFFRLVGEYFERTAAVFEALVMDSRAREFEAAANTLQQLKQSEASLVHIERELVREGEKLSDMLAMPVKDALGRDLQLDYSADIANVRDILETTMARRSIFSDSVELQKLTLEQLAHIRAYEDEARTANRWLQELYAAMTGCHSHVGSNIHEIQVQKDELQTFQETGKSIYNYGCQLLEAAQALRCAGKLDACPPRELFGSLQRTWHSLQAIGQEHMTRLRVSAVFHRSVEDYSQQLTELRLSVRRLLRQAPHCDPATLAALQHSSSSGISSEESDASTTTAAAPSEAVGMVEPLLSTATAAAEKAATTAAALERREELRKHLAVREQLLVEVGRMVRLGRLLKTRLKEPFILDAHTGKSIIVDDLGTDASSPINSTDSAEANGEVAASATAPATIVVAPTDNNAIACNAIAQKLNEISEVAESLDAAIRDVQSDAAAAIDEAPETNVRENEVEKKPTAPATISGIEDWHSRSTEDESFATASEGNFTPHSHSSSFQTASGRSSTYISCDKDSFDADASEADDSTFAFEMPELMSPLNMSYASSEHSLPGAPPIVSLASTSAATGSAAQPPIDDDQQSDAGVEELRSQSVTPTPDNEQYDVVVTGVESDSELGAIGGIADAPPIEVLSETPPPAVNNSVTPEVSNNGSTAGQHATNSKHNAAWRRSKYYENLTKQTIKGFL